MKIKKITWSVDPIARHEYFFTLYGGGMRMRVSRNLTATEMDKAFGAMHLKGFVVLPQE